MRSLDRYDFYARQFTSAIVRFASIDLLAEKYYSWSPYAYCLNNPLKFVDPDGKQSRSGIRPRAGRYRNNNRYANYPNGIRPPSIQRSTIIKYSLSTDYISSPISTFTTPGQTTIQISRNNNRGKFIALAADRGGVFIKNIERKVAMKNGIKTEREMKINFADHTTNLEYQKLQAEYEAQYEEEMSNLENLDMSEITNSDDFFINWLAKHNMKYQR